MDSINLKKHTFLFISIILLLIGIPLLSYSNHKVADCDSLGVKVIQAFDSATRKDCADANTLRILAIATIAASVACMIVYAIKR